MTRPPWAILGLFSRIALGVTLRATSYPIGVADILEALASPPNTLEARVPLSTNDNTSRPLVDMQIYQPPVVPKITSSCLVNLLTHDFGNSYGTPAVVPYTPPENCGPIGKWAAISLNLTVYS